MNNRKLRVCAVLLACPPHSTRILMHYLFESMETRWVSKVLKGYKVRRISNRFRQESWPARLKPTYLSILFSYSTAVAGITNWSCHSILYASFLKTGISSYPIKSQIIILAADSGLDDLQWWSESKTGTGKPGTERVRRKSVTDPEKERDYLSWVLNACEWQECHKRTRPGKWLHSVNQTDMKFKVTRGSEDWKQSTSSDRNRLLKLIAFQI